MTPRSAARGLAAGALLVAGVTVAARVLGFGRWIVFSKTVEGGCLADVYNTANLLPNVLFEIVAGGALAGAVVPVLAGALAQGDREQASRTTSALLTWAVLGLIPVAVAVAVLAGPLMTLFLGSAPGCGPAAHDFGTRMLLIFIPQLFCYAAAVVLGGALQAHHRFFAAAAAPLVSSTVVIGAYLAFAALAEGAREVVAVPADAELTLAGGTTAGVAALAATVAAPMRSTGLRLRPRLSFPDGVAPRVRALAAAGIAVLLAQQVTLLLVVWLANNHGVTGSVTAYTWAQASYLLPYAVLAVPLATTAFPRLSASAAAGDLLGFRRLTGRTTRAVVLVSGGGAAMLGAVAAPLAAVFAAGAAGVDAPALAAGIRAFAPGVVGFGLVALLGRVLYALHQARRAAVATVIGWLAVMVADLVLIAALPADSAVGGLAAGNSLGMAVAGGGLLVAVARAGGPGCLRGLGRTAAAAILAGAVAAAVGTGLGAVFDATGLAAALAASVVVATAAAAVYLAIVAIADRATVRLLVDGRLLNNRARRSSHA